MSFEFLLFFFFSSRRRHTRCSRDWSSDVCSSDLRRNFPGRTVARASVKDATLMLQMNWNPPIKLQPVVQDEFNVGRLTGYWEQTRRRRAGGFQGGRETYFCR